MKNKKVLIVTYYWYPSAGVGTYRVSRFAKYLSRLGWDVVILTTEKAVAGMEGKPDDPALDNLKVYRSRIIEPTNLLNKKNKDQGSTSNPGIFYQKDKKLLDRFAVWARLNLMVPDAKFTWKWFAVPLGKKIIELEKPDLIFSTSPPPTTSLIAKKLAEWSNLPWLADFRDPWTNIYYYDDNPQSPWARKRNKRLESSVLDRADKITMVNHGFFSDSKNIIEKKSTKIPNGFDPDHIVTEQAAKEPSDKFSIRYFGSLKANQYPKAFVAALRNIEISHPEIAAQIQVEFFGSIDPIFKKDLANSVKNITCTFTGFIQHDDMMKKVKNTDLLLLAIGRTKNSKFALSTKVFEYMISGNQVLGIGPIDGAAAQLVNETNIGSFFEHDDMEGVTEFILKSYTNSKTNQGSIPPNKSAISSYSFEKLTESLEKIMRSLLD